MWNADAAQFFATANAAGKKKDREKDDAAAFLQLFAEMQEGAEDENDLVLHRTCYYTPFSAAADKRHPTLLATTRETKEAVLAAYKASSLQQAAPQQDIVIQQIYITLWPALCLAGMAYILLQFVIFYRGAGNGIDGISWTEESMTKHSAMLLSCVYAALAWALSNGLVLNPRKDIGSALQQRQRKTD